MRGAKTCDENIWSKKKFALEKKVKHGCSKWQSWRSSKQWLLAYNQSRRQSPGKLERLEKWLLNRFCQKQSLHFGENERILFPERSWDYKKVGNKSSVERKYQWIPEEQVTAGVPAWRACQGQGLVPNPRRAGKALGICLFVVWFCFLNRDVPGGKGVVRNMIWY